MSSVIYRLKPMLKLFNITKALLDSVEALRKVGPNAVDGVKKRMEMRRRHYFFPFFFFFFFFFFGASSSPSSSEGAGETETLPPLPMLVSGN